MKTCPSCHKRWPDTAQFCAADGTLLSTTTSDQAGLVNTVIAGRFRIEKELGGGGMGTVYLAKHVRMGNRVAVKIISRDLANDADVVARFTREAANAVKIDHRNVCRTIDMGDDGELLFIVMEFVDGKSLGEIILSHGPLQVPRAIRVIGQCCHAIQAAHELGIVHRDIKPENIMITGDGNDEELVKVVDFGIAKSLGQTLTRTGQIVGSPKYMSPEQLMGESLDTRSDIYSLALVFFEMVTGELPFPDADTMQDLIAQRLTGSPRTLSDAWPHGSFSIALQGVVNKALAVKIDARFGEPMQFAQALEKAGDTRDETHPLRDPRYRHRSTIDQPSLPDETHEIIAGRPIRPIDRRASIPTRVFQGDDDPHDSQRPASRAKGTQPERANSMHPLRRLAYVLAELPPHRRRSIALEFQIGDVSERAITAAFLIQRARETDQLKALWDAAARHTRDDTPNPF